MRGGLQEYCRRTKIELEKSSAENPQSNGASEAAVKQVKQVFAKCTLEGRSKEEGLFMLQATPRRVGQLSPMRLFYCREPRVPGLPCCTDLRDEKAAGQARNMGKLEAKERANLQTQRLDTSPMDLATGMKVIMRNSKTNKWDVKGEVISVRPGGRSCYIKLEGSNRTYLRNRRLLRVDPELQTVTEESFAISWTQAPQGTLTCLARQREPWQAKKSGYITKKEGGRYVEFSTEEPTVFYYSQV